MAEQTGAPGDGVTGGKPHGSGHEGGDGNKFQHAISSWRSKSAFPSTVLVEGEES